jgi:hypothetical protein
MFRNTFITIAIVTVLNSCQHKIGSVGTTTVPSQDSILFLAYEVKKDSVSGKISLDILFQKKTAGLVKPNSMDNASSEPGNWRITAKDKKDKSVQTLLLENPLHKKLEYVDANGNMAIKDVWLNRTELTVRMNYKMNMHKIVIQEMVPDNKNTSIFSHSIMLTD